MHLAHTIKDTRKVPVSTSGLALLRGDQNVDQADAYLDHYKSKKYIYPTCHVNKYKEVFTRDSYLYTSKTAIYRSSNVSSTLSAVFVTRSKTLSVIFLICFCLHSLPEQYVKTVKAHLRSSLTSALSWVL